MRSLTYKAFLFLAMLLAFEAITALSVSEEEPFVEDADEESNETSSSSLRGINRFLAEKNRKPMTCDKYPRVCRSKGSPGPDCCKKKCVNVGTDKLNCGKCGKKCKYPEICCKGKCVNPMSNRKHCGGCNNKCKKGSKCLYGMCSYA